MMSHYMSHVPLYVLSEDASHHHHHHHYYYYYYYYYLHFIFMHMNFKIHMLSMEIFIRLEHLIFHISQISPRPS
jgi:hypothetical protein